MSIDKQYHIDLGRGDAELGIPSLSHMIDDKEAKKAYEEGYAARYEEEQKLTNQVEEQESGN